ncbi:MAG: hypothetical protein QOJ15_7475 [Bradyrhizobium sp.]|jgi:hypothetical protein|nr:hypothetical protein [Bradyrhizobium sp.]
MVRSAATPRVSNHAAGNCAIVISESPFVMAGLVPAIHVFLL